MEPLATPLKSWIGWVWQFDGQWCMITDHDSAEAGSVPSWASVAEPRKAIVSPTAQVNVDAGASIFAWGGVLPGVIVTVSVAVAPWGSVTVSLATYVPALL